MISSRFEDSPGTAFLHGMNELIFVLRRDANEPLPAIDENGIRGHTQRVGEYAFADDLGNIIVQDGRLVQSKRAFHDKPVGSESVSDVI